MLIIEEEESLDKKKLNINKRKVKKSQILLFDTQRRYDDYISKLKYRYNGQYDDIPHFVVTKLGKVYSIFNSSYSSKTFDNQNFDKKLIKIAVENLGWLSRNTISGVYTNWVDDIYRGEPYIKNWRNKFYWDEYTSLQYNSLQELCGFLCEEHRIPKKIVLSNGFINFNAIKNFEGISCKSNFSNIYTDINPSFNFTGFFKNNDNAQSIR
jgi:hypothetical protein